MQTGIRSLPNVVPARNFSELNNLAVLRYAGAAKANPTDDPTVNVPVSKLPLVETNLHVGAVMIITSWGLTFPCLATHKLSRCKFYYIYYLHSHQWSHAFQPGNPVPGGADININLDVVLVRTQFCSCDHCACSHTYTERGPHKFPCQWGLLRSPHCPRLAPDIKWREERIGSCPCWQHLWAPAKPKCRTHHSWRCHRRTCEYSTIC